MKKYWIALLFIVRVLFAVAQSDPVTYYFNKYGKQTEKDNADVYSIVEKWLDKHWYVKVYDSKYRLRYKGQFTNINLTNKQDSFYFYFPNGQLESKGLYVNDVKTGVWFSWFNDGKLDCRCTYKSDSTSKCVYYHYNGAVSAVVEYLNDTTLITARMWDSLGVSSTNTYLLIPPTLNGYEDGWRKFFAKNMKYPEDEEGNRIKATVEFWILIDRFGKAHWGDVEGFAHPFLALELERMINKMPMWTPAIEQNRPVDKILWLGFSFNPEY